MLRLVLALAAALALGVHAPRAQTPPPIEVFAALPAISHVSLSPDGSTLAYLRRQPDSTKVVVQSRTGELIAAVETGQLQVSGVAWASPDHVVVSWISSEHFPLGGHKGRFEILDVLNVRTHSYERVLKRADRNAYTSIFGWRAGVYRGQPALFVMAPTYEEGDLTLDVYRVDLDSGRGYRLHRGDSDTYDYVLTETGEAVARTAYQPDNGFWRLSTRTSTGWREIYTETSPLDEPFLGGIGRSPDTLVLSRKQGDGGYRFTEISAGDGSVREVFDLKEDPNSILHARNGQMIGLGWVDTYQQYRFFEPKLQTAYDTLTEMLPNRQVQVASFSDDYGVVAFYVEGSGESGGYYLFDGARNRVSIVGRSFPGVPGEAISEVRAIRYAAADGRELMGYLTLPTGREPRGLPVVVMPHGGPASRDYAGYDWLAQALASRGYAVFQPQFRGSAGFGQELLEAGYGEWGRKMQSDVSDGLRHLVGQGVVDADRACIVGWSYGGYAALAGMTMEAGTYRCAVSIAGVSDLRAMLQEAERRGAGGDSNPTIRYWNRFMGASGPDDRSLDARSPAQLAARAEGPILLIHGRDDLTVPFRQSELMLRALGGESEKARLIALPGQDHSVLQSQTERTRLLQETVAFLEAHNPPR